MSGYSKILFVVLITLLSSCGFNIPQIGSKIFLRKNHGDNVLIIQKGTSIDKIIWSSDTISRDILNIPYDPGLYISLDSENTISILPMTHKQITHTGNGFDVRILARRDTIFPFKGNEMNSYFHSIITYNDDSLVQPPILYVNENIVLYKESSDELPVCIYEKGLTPVINSIFFPKNDYASSVDGMFESMMKTDLYRTELILVNKRTCNKDTLEWFGSPRYIEPFIIDGSHIYQTQVKPTNLSSIKHYGDSSLSNLLLEQYKRDYISVYNTDDLNTMSDSESICYIVSINDYKARINILKKVDPTDR